MDADSLSCTICSKKPHFSDLSHLLTHIASKAHLATYFKLQVKSRHDSDARQTLALYDRWYQQNGLAKSLSDRMATSSKAKGRRRSSRQTEPTEDAGNIKNEPVGSKFPALSDCNDHTEHRSAQWPFFEDNIDPRLSNMQHPIHQPSVDEMSYAAASSFSDPYEHTFIKVESDSLYEWKEYQPGNLLQRNAVDHPELEESHPFGFRPRIHRTPPPMFSHSPMDSKPHIIGESKSDEMMRLKGIQWPGMDIFDAATESMKRQRNQKKDATTFKAMEKSSDATEPNEMVFSPSGTLRKEREITGYVEDEDDLLPGEWSIPKPRRDRRDRRDRNGLDIYSNATRYGSRLTARVALLDSDPNRNVLSGRITKKGHQPKHQISRELAGQDLVIAGRSLNKNSRNTVNGFGGLKKDENVDLQLSIEATSQRRGSRLQVFKDMDQPVREPKDNTIAPNLIDATTSRGEPFRMAYYQSTPNAINTLSAANDYEQFPSSLSQSGLPTVHDYSQDHPSLSRTQMRNIDSMYLIDSSSGLNRRGLHDPLISGDVLHYRWDWHESDAGREDYNSNESLLSSGLLYNRAASSGSTIYDDEAESKNRLWVDGTCA
ncbi:hypothetical protein BGW36DRAFT_443706 [Talaromyces proteolyticus]|uniref:Uncharacterized protein n=1 Tax=Talaromyces proteolyticus TaxID=1131652 RepID=A0AAD4L4L0_9EURO|nr:uncharacterized protein BGW36DRAFT_443706 [Talaromyces proteolyticus]KAH8703467.1 hypothetical protein BGW36DRAFT_443706 [Talaromyces proteolyticus]